jgi:hypothetical protein
MGAATPITRPGNVISTGAVGSEPTAAKSGDLYLPNNGYAVEEYNGSAWGKANWGPAFPFTVPADPGNWLNQSNATISTPNNQGYILQNLTSNGSSHGLNLRYQAYTTNQVVTCAFLPMFFPGANTSFCGLAFYDSVGGKIVTFAVSNNGDGHLTLYELYYTNATTLSSIAAGPSIANNFAGKPLFFRIVDNNTNLVWSLSADGQNFMAIATFGDTAFLANKPNKVGVYVEPYNSAVIMNVLSYTQA